MLNSFNPVLQVKYIGSYYKTNCFKEEFAVDRGEIRRFILEIKGPFSSTDLFLLLEKEERRLKQQKGQGHDGQEKNVELRDLALQVLDELYNRGLIGFKQFGESSYRFYVKP